MSKPNAFNAASNIEDMVAKTRHLVDHAELYPDSAVNFQEVRLMLNAIENEAQYIRSQTEPPKIKPVRPSETWEPHRQEELPEAQDA